jgi:hypothetical protein
MTSFGIKQIGLSLCLMASLFVGAASACTCSHHEAEVKPSVPSCHQLAEMAEVSGPQFENTAYYLVPDDDCVCVETAQKLVAKSEAIKLKKCVARGSVEIRIATLLAGTFQTASGEFVKLTYLSDSFYSLSLSRGPPARL